MWGINNIVKYTVMTLLVLMIAIGNASATASISISPESHTGLSPGETFNVNIDVNSGVSQLSAAHIKLDYDPNAFEVIGITKGSLFENDALIEPESGDDGDGTITYGFADSNYDAPGSGTLISIEFQIKDTIEGVYSLSFKEAKLLDQNKDYLVGEATGSSVVVGDVTDDASTPLETIDLASQTKSTSGSSSSSTSVVEPQLGYAYIFGFHPDDYKVIGRYGTTRNDESWSQNSLILENELVTEFEGQYLFPQGKIVSIGSNSAGYLVVVFYEPLMVDRTEMDGIYAIIDQNAQDMDIGNVPVEFAEGTISDVSDQLQELIQRVQAINEMELGDFMNNESSLYDPTVVATAGKLPQINTEKECWQWYFQDSYAISLNVSDEMDDYLQSGILLSTGLSPDGYFEVKINEETDANKKSLITDVYQLMNREATNIGVSEVPVVFKLGSPDEIEDRLTSTQEEASDEVQGTEGEAKATPGFGYLIGILSITLAYCMRSKT
ncbi:cohesin domain-containing protein [Methanolobus mangrovi]|uniref:Cohesin domain-containing protein n=1 Tax=Methanolobus mangrovi TaxID=3072977 RepID=A0AA51YH09_9EURY|nr:cohesin domain-containing protein [Methanolobus mangrovi]WMW22666.1 cohesin domain-containing protein [Methanolobus mangrovi]